MLYLNSLCVWHSMTNDTFCDNYMLTDLCDKFTQYLFARNNWLQWQRKTGLWCDYNTSICDQRCISPWLLLLSCKVWLLLMGWPMACDPSRPMSHAGHPPSVVTCPGHLAPGANGLNSLQTSATVLQLVTIECFLLGLNNLSSDSVSALLYSITRGKNVWSCHGGNDGPQRETIPWRTYNISHS